MYEVTLRIQVTAIERELLEHIKSKQIKEEKDRYHVPSNLLDNVRESLYKTLIGLLDKDLIEAVRVWPDPYGEGITVYVLTKLGELVWKEIKDL
jgi:hypothetical protein